MARLVLYALAALARAYDWTTPGQALTKFDCDAYPNPIQVFKADDSNPPYNVSELDLATGKYNKICDFPQKMTGFIQGQAPGPGLYEMFTKAVAFNQNLGWCVSEAVNPQQPSLTFSGTVCGSYDCGVRTVANPATDC